MLNKVSELDLSFSLLVVRHVLASTFSFRRFCSSFNYQYAILHFLCMYVCLFVCVFARACVLVIVHIQMCPFIHVYLFKFLCICKTHTYVYVYINFGCYCYCL